MKKRMIGIVIFLLLCFGLMPASALAEDAVTVSDEEMAAKSNRIYVNGVKVTEENADDVLGDIDGEAATVTYDAATNTLTLKDAVITDGWLYKDNCEAGIVSTKDLNIVVEGQNSITAPDTAGYSQGILISGNLFISGDGTLTAKGGNVTAAADKENYFESAGISVDGGITVSEAEVIAVGGNVTVTGGVADESSRYNVAYSFGIWSYDGLILDNGAILNASGGEANINTVNPDYALSGGIVIYDNDVAVYDASLKVSGDKAVSGESALSYGAIIYDADVHVYESSAEVMATSKEAEASEETSANGICIYGGDLVIEAGNVTISGGERTATNGDSHAVYVEGKILEDGTVLGGGMYVKCDEVVLGPSDGFIGTTLNISASEGDAVFAKYGLQVADSLTISEPVGGRIEQIEKDTDQVHYTIVNESGNAAQNVTIKPLIYSVDISGMSCELTVEIPAGKSVNEIYCEKYGVSDFSETLEIEKKGYLFSGYYTDEACTDGKEYTFNDPVNADITIYPKWTKVLLYVGGVAVTEDNAADVFGDGTVTYDTQTHTLTLKDAVITGEYEYEEACNASIYSAGDLNIVLDGTKSSVTATDSVKMSRGIMVGGNLSISGIGVLEVAGGNVTADDTAGQSDSCGMYVWGSLVVSGCSIEATGGSASGYIASSNGIVVIDGDISINNASVTAVGGKVSGVTAGSTGLLLNNGEMVVSGERTMLTLRGGDCETDEENGYYGYSRGLCVVMGNVTIEDGTITATGGKWTGVNGDNYGVAVAKEQNDNGADIGGNITIRGGDITMEGTTKALYVEGNAKVEGNWYRWMDQKNGTWNEEDYVYDPEKEITYLHIQPVEDSKSESGENGTNAPDSDAGTTADKDNSKDKNGTTADKNSSKDKNGTTISTGDHSGLWLWCILVIGSGAVLSALTVLRRKTK